jgi:endonuclease/exonuclease/phosphatase family metal-dependent hydrolase
MRLKILSYNIHKGFNWNNSELTIKLIKDMIQSTHAEVVFLQEVVGENQVYTNLKEGWINSQYEFLADQRWPQFAYAQNAIYENRHHGNAILSKYPISKWEQINISTNKFEQRGVLFCEIQLPLYTLHAYCVHLNLLHRSRIKQYEMLSEIINQRTPSNIPVIIAGDFNDWNQKASNHFEEVYGFVEAYKSLHGNYAKTFPAQYPILSLDRMYVRNINPEIVKVYNDYEWKSISDHAAMYMEGYLRE